MTLSLTSVEEQLEHFSLEQQLGNKTKVNKYHLPLSHSSNWCGNINIWNEYATFHHDVIHGRRSGKGYLRYYLIVILHTMLCI